LHFERSEAKYFTLLWIIRDGFAEVPIADILLHSQGLDKFGF